MGIYPGTLARLTCVALLGTVPLVTAPAQASDAPPFSHSDSQVVTHAHRGESGMAPENTAAAFELAIASGADFIETDVQLSADGELVIIHDATLVRTTDAEQVFPDRSPWRVQDFTLAELKMLDAGSWYSPKFAGQRILTLDELLDLVRGRAGLNIEIKSPAANPGLAEKLAASLRRHPGWISAAEPAQRLIVGSFDEQALRDFHAQLPNVPVAYITYDVPSSEKLAELAGWVDSVNPDYRRLRPEDAARVIAAGIDLVPWTVDAPEYWRWLIDLGVDGLITNYTFALENMLYRRDPVPGEETVVVDHIVFNPAGDDVRYGAGEYVVLRNVTDRPIDVSGWYLRDQVSNKVVVGDGYVIPAGGVLYVHSGPGDNDANRYFNGRTSAVWNNDGDSASLHRADDAIVDLYAYIP
jgi:glycerophosphoryl diester phosphodiesterase